MIWRLKRKRYAIHVRHCIRALPLSTLGEFATNKPPSGVNYFFRFLRLKPDGVIGVGCHNRVASMKKVSLIMAAVFAFLSITGCAQYYGKGKAPPPIVTKD